MPNSQSLRADAIEIWRAGIEAVDPRSLVKNLISIGNGQLSIGSSVFSIDEINRVVVVGFGKASGAMAVGFEDGIAAGKHATALPLEVAGLVCVPDDRIVDTKLIKIVGGRPPGENLPTQRVREATNQILKLVQSAGPNDVCVCLVAGGGSALLELPLDTITMEELRTATTHLSASGASIYQLNAVRRAISQVKGGSLAAAAGATPVVSLIISDVIGDNLDVISSGPTVEPSNDVCAVEVLQRFDPERTEIPASIWEAIESDAKPTVKFSDDANISNTVIGNIETALNAAKAKATQLGYACELGQPSGNEGDAETVGRQARNQINQLLSRGNKQCFIQGGETTVKLCPDPGHGGRNQHLVLAAIDEFTKQPLTEIEGDFCLLSGGSDGEDGSAPQSGIAGAIADRGAIEQIRKLASGQTAAAIGSCSSFDFHLAHGSLLKVGDVIAATRSSPPATNVCDLRIVLVSP